MWTYSFHLALNRSVEVYGTVMYRTNLFPVILASAGSEERSTTLTPPLERIPSNSFCRLCLNRKSRSSYMDSDRNASMVFGRSVVGSADLLLQYLVYDTV